MRLLSRLFSHVCIAAVLTLILFAPQDVFAQTSQVIYILGATNNEASVESRYLLRFNRFDRGGNLTAVSTLGQITGMVEPGEVIQAIDFRPATGQLYGVSSRNRLYTINTETAVIAPISTTPFRPAASLSDSTTAVAGFDFNPVTDRIRLIDSETGGDDSRRNVRLDATTGELVADDTQLAYADDDVNAGRTPNVNAVAHTENFASATSTTLFGIDSTLDVLTRQGSTGGSPISPNEGRLTTVGNLGVDTSAFVGFDISAENGTAYAALNIAGGTSLYTINLTTGVATLIGPIRRDVDNPPLTVIDIAAGLSVRRGIVVSEFRLRGPGGENDEFIEFANITDVPITVSTADSSTGWSVFAVDDGGALSFGGRAFVIPVGTVIPAHGHYLVTNRFAYSLAFYPAGTDANGNPRTATPDLDYVTNIPDNGSLALFRSASNLSLATRLDAVGFGSGTTNALYREGTGLTAINAENNEYSFVRRVVNDRVQDTDNNVADFVFISTTGSAFGRTGVAGTADGPSILGAPGPENSSSPTDRAADSISIELLDPSQPSVAKPNLVREDGDAPQGVLLLRRRITNMGTRPITRLRFRVVDISTLGGSPGNKRRNDANLRGMFRMRSRVLPTDLRVFSSSSSTLSGRDGLPRGTIRLSELTLEEPPMQPQGGGLNSSLVVPSITAGSPLTPGETVNVEFKLGIQQFGQFRFDVIAEALS